MELSFQGLKRLYLSLLKQYFFNKLKRGQEPNLLGAALIPLLPSPRVRWKNGVSVKANCMNLRWIERSMLGHHEPALDRFFLKILKKGDNYIDVGGQVGLTTVMAATIIGPEGRVIAIEPDTYNYKMLRRSLRLNNLSNVKTFNLAAGDECGEAVFENETLSGLTQKASDGESGRKVKITTIDELVRNEGLKSLSFLKIDIDGPDFKALLGAKETIGRHRPVIVIEVSFWWKRFGYGFQDLYRFLHDLDYEIAVSRRKGLDLTSIGESTDLPKGWGEEKGKAINVYAVPASYAQSNSPLG